MKNGKKHFAILSSRFSWVIYLLFFSFIFVSCSPVTMNDFFGIQMKPDQAEHFVIVGYTDEGGVQYASTPDMNTSLYAYGEMGAKSIVIKIMNKGLQPVEINYNADEFFIYMEGQKYVLIKGEWKNYPSIESLGLDEEVEFNLELPQNFWNVVGITKPQSSSENYTEDFWTGENSLNFVKEKIQYIEIKLAGKTTIIMKPIVSS